jgi:hypothetical protein
MLVFFLFPFARFSVLKVGYMAYVLEVRIGAGPLGEMFQNQNEKVL